MNVVIDSSLQTKHLEASKQFVAIDIEASGLHSSSFPIEVGWCLPDGSPHSVLIKPHYSWSIGNWDIAAEDLHGISLKRLQTEGKTVGEVSSLLRKELSEFLILSDGCEFDQHWLDMIFAADKCDEILQLTDLYSWLGSQAKVLGIDSSTLIGRLHHFDDHTQREHRAAADAIRLRMLVSYCLGVSGCNA